MVDPSSASAAFGGERLVSGRRVGRLRGREFAALEDWIRDQREAQARTSLGHALGVAPGLRCPSCNAPVASRAQRLQAEDIERIVAGLRAEPVTFSLLYDWIRQDSGLRQALTLGARSLDRDCPETFGADADVPGVAKLGLAIWLIGMDVVEPNPEAAEGDPESPPTKSASSPS